MKKQTKTEAAAAAFCEHAKASKAPLVLLVQRSDTGGVSVHARSQMIGHATGYGYDKHSAALATVLYPLGANPAEQRAIALTNAVGIEAVTEALADCGWALQWAGSVGRVTAYTLSRK